MEKLRQYENKQKTKEMSTFPLLDKGESTVVQQSQPLNPLYRDMTISQNEISTYNNTNIRSKPKKVKLLDKEMSLADVVIGSSLADKNPKQQTKNVIDAFNNRIELSKVITTDAIRGKRIAPGQFKVFTLNNQAIIVGPTEKNIARTLHPFSTSQVTSHGLYSQTQEVISRGGKYIVNVAPGHIAKAKLGNKPIFLGDGPHVIRDANFSLNARDGIVPLSQTYIQHGTYHFLNVPSGKLAKVYIDGTPHLLPSRPQPYIFNTARFKIEKDGNDNYFVDATKKVITHGATKRLIVDTGEVAIVSDNGTLRIIKPNNKGEPMVFDSPLLRVADNPFVPTNIQTIIFPADEGNQEKYEHAQTADGVRVKMKLMITYNIENPQLAIEQLTNPDEILKHIEYCALTDMRNATQNSNYYAVQQSTGAKAHHKINNNTSNPSIPSAPQYYQNIQDEIKSQLATELKDVGIKLGRLAFEEFIIDDKKVQEQRSSNAQAIANTTSQVSNLQQERTLKLQTEQTRLEVMKIKLAQNKQEHLAKAQVDLEKTGIQLQKDYKVAESTARQDAVKETISKGNQYELMIKEAEAKLKVAELEMKAVKLRAEGQRAQLTAEGEVYEKYDRLFEIKMAEMQYNAVGQIKTAIVSPKVAQNIYGAFGARGPAAGQPLFFNSPEQTGVVSQATIGK